MIRRGRPTHRPASPEADGVVAIGEAPERRPCRIEGQIVRMRMRPTRDLPSLAITLRDATGSATALWTGRREIGGITLGRRLRIEGVGVQVGDRLEFTNPAYTLLP